MYENFPKCVRFVFEKWVARGFCGRQRGVESQRWVAGCHDAWEKTDICCVMKGKACSVHENVQRRMEYA